jgi:hypothetical protein
MAILGGGVLSERFLRSRGEQFIDRVVGDTQNELGELLIDGVDVSAGETAKLCDFNAVGDGHGEVPFAFEDQPRDAAR